MVTRSAPPALGQTLAGSALVFVSLAAVAAGLTLLFLGMRAVMDVGGACADGGPYVSAQPCPEGVPLAMLSGLWGGLAALAVYAWQTIKRGVPGLLGFAWPALFLSLGWNFIDYGLDPPGEQTLEWGWLVCGVVFGLMGGIPLLLFLPLLARSLAPFGHPPGHPGPEPSRGLRSVLPAVTFTAAPAKLAGRRAATEYDADRSPAVVSDDSVVAVLERLAQLHASGALTEAEFALAKERVLGGGAG